MKKIILIGSFLIIFLLVGLNGCIKPGTNILQNSGFECGSDEAPSDWFKAIIAHEDLTMMWDSNVYYNGSYSAGIHNTHIYNEVVHNNWYQRIEDVTKGRFLELTGWIKTVDAESVSMFIECIDKNYNMVAAASTQTTCGIINGTNDWTKYNTFIFVPMSTSEIGIRLILTGTGQVWFDDIELKVIK